MGRADNDSIQEKRIYACWLSAVPGIGNRTIDKLLQLCGDEREVYHAGEAVWRQVMTARQLEQMRDFVRTREPERLYDNLLNKGIKLVLREEGEYPERLKKIPDPPYALYVKGELPCTQKPSVAVVGARDCSEYGSYVAAGIGEVLANNGIQVISGMARGIDGISQRAALQAGGSSFGVLGCGVDICYPPSNRKLYEELCERGGVLSVFPPGTEARAGNFPPRNRIVSGLSDVLIVVEARIKSGTLITVDMALEQGKDVYVVPGRITDRLSDGCNRLLKQGADVFISPEDFLQALWERWSCGPVGHILKSEEACWQWKPAAGAEALEGVYREVYATLTIDPLTPQQLQSKLSASYSIAQLMSILMKLSVQGLVTQITPGHFVLKSS